MVERWWVCVLVAAGAAWGDWPTDPTVSLAIGAGPGEQVVPKLALTSDGGAYVGWFDNAGGGYAVRLQRVDPDGSLLWGEAGILVSDEAQQGFLVAGIRADGGTICAWDDDRNDSEDVYGQAVRAGGTLGAGCYGPFNGDGSLDILDFVSFQNAFVGGEGSADCDGDGALNVLDFVCFQGAFVGGC
jgi:hypothetical protein